MFSFLYVINISANKMCLHSELQWPISPLCLWYCPTSCPLRSADAGEVSFHGMLYISLKSNFSLPFFYQRISQWLENSLLGERTGFKSLERQWKSGVLAAPLFGAMCIGSVCYEAHWKGEGISTTQMISAAGRIPDKSEIFWHLFSLARLTVQLFTEFRSGCTRKAESPHHTKNFLDWGKWH